jgi:hypothetical protein
MRMPMRRWGLGVAGAVILGNLAGWAEEEITLTTYYPSPRGVYNELRANRYASFTEPEKYVLEMTSEVVLYDKATGQDYSLNMERGRLLLTDLKRGKSFLLLELPED